MDDGSPEKNIRLFLKEIYDTYVTDPDTGRKWFNIGFRQNYGPRALEGNYGS